MKKLHTKILRELPVILILGFLLILNLTAIAFAQDGKIRAAAEEEEIPDNQYVEVHVLGINDFHGQLDSVKTVKDRPAGGADCLAAYLEQRRSAEKNTLIVHAGDMVGGSAPSSALFQDEPTIELMNQVGFDVGIPGNHELDDGYREMIRLINGGYHVAAGWFQGANFPYISANMIDPDTGDPVLDPYIIKKVEGIPIGFIGVTLSDMSVYQDPAELKEVLFSDEIKAVNQAAAVLKRQNVKTIILLAHVDGSSGTIPGRVGGQLADLAVRVDDEIDVVIAGHSHISVNGNIDGKLIVESLCNGLAFSDISLKIDPATGDTVSKEAEIVITYRDSITPDARIAKLISSYAFAIKDLVNRPVSISDNSIMKKPNVAGEAALGDLITDAYRWKTDTDLAFINTTGIRGDLDSGIITWGDLYTIQPFRNHLIKIMMTGQQIRDVLNQQFQNGKTLQVSGLEYTWSKNQVEDIFLEDGSDPLDPEKIYSVTVNSFLGGGGDGFTVFRDCAHQEMVFVDLDSLTEYLEQSPKPISAAIEGRIIKL